MIVRVRGDWWVCDLVRDGKVVVVILILRKTEE